jgi:hypothetical protein
MTMRTIATLFVACGLVLAGCGDSGGDETGGDASATGDSTGGGTTTTSTTATTTTSTTTAGTGEESTGGGGTTAATTGVDESTGGGATEGTGGSGGDVCMVEMDDDECAICTKENCCAELSACYANPDCMCVVDCVNEMGLGAVMTCLADVCMAAFPPEAGPLQQCNTTNCMMECGG